MGPGFAEPADRPPWVKTGRTQAEYIKSASPQRADIQRTCRVGRLGPRAEVAPTVTTMSGHAKRRRRVTILAIRRVVDLPHI